ncbi:MAG: hypothetical protein LBD13_05735 [Spirochaetaceae bacterium]|nr:hypothetical protein [Spirochaetaceae bacterium]
MSVLKKRNRIPCAALAGAFAALALISCATGPAGYTKSLAGAGEFAALAAGGAVYLTVNVPASRPILDALDIPLTRNMNKKRAAQILDRTRSAAAAYYPAGSPRRFQAAAQGSYPKGRADIAFFFDGAWKKRKSAAGGSYWHSAKDALSVSLSGDRAFFSDGDPFTPQPGVMSPAGFEDFKGGAAFAGWIENPPELFNRFLGSLGLPFKITATEAFFAVHQAGGLYQGTIRIKTPAESDAKGIAAMMRIAGTFMALSGAAENGERTPAALLAGVFFANPPEQDGVYLTIRTASLEPSGMALLLSQLSVYSTQNQP